MSFPDAFAPDMVLGPDQMLPTVPRGFGERFDLEWKAARAPDKWFYNESRLNNLWDDALEKLHKATGQTFPNPYRLPAGSQRRTGVFGEELPPELLKGQTPRRDDVMPDILAAFDQARAGQFDLPDPRLFEDTIRAEATKMRGDAARAALAGYGASGLGAFLGAAAGELSHPVNLATLPIGGTYATANIARVGLLRFIGRAALAESAVAAASQTAIEIADAPYQERLGTDTGIEDRLERIFIAGAGGAILGAGLSSLVGLARGIRARGRVAATLDEADALKVAERATLHDGKNPLGPDGVTAHARAVETAEVQVAAGRHADVDQIVREEVRRQVAQPAPSRAAPTPPEAPSPAPISSSIAPDARLAEDPQSTLAAPFRHPEPVPLGAEFAALPAMRQSVELNYRQVYFSDPKLIDDVENRAARGLTASQISREFKDRFNQVGLAYGEHQGAVIAIRDKLGIPSQLSSEDKAAFQAWQTAYNERQALLSLQGARTQPAGPATITRAIADSAPPVPEKAAATAKAEMEMSNAMAIAETNAGAKAALEAASEESKMANKVKNCAMGVAIG